LGYRNVILLFSDHRTYFGHLQDGNCENKNIVLGDKSTTYMRVTLFWGHLIILWLFCLVCILVLRLF